MRRIIEKMVGEDDPLAHYQSPTDMGVNMAKEGIIDDAVVREASKQEIVRRYFRYHREFIEGDTTRETLERMEHIMKKVGVSPEDRLIVMPARAAALDAKTRHDEGKGYRGLFCGAAIEMFDKSGRLLIITGKNSPLLHAEAAVLLNAVKLIAGISDEIEVISPTVIESMRQLKSAMDLDGTSLHTDENARKCIEALKKLQGCDIHTTHLMDAENEKPLKQLGLRVTTDAELPFPNYMDDE
jgi:uncharacterized protein (UPF0371 family)